MLELWHIEKRIALWGTINISCGGHCVLDYKTVLDSVESLRVQSSRGRNANGPNKQLKLQCGSAAVRQRGSCGEQRSFNMALTARVVEFGANTQGNSANAFIKMFLTA